MCIIKQSLKSCGSITNIHWEARENCILGSSVSLRLISQTLSWLF